MSEKSVQEPEQELQKCDRAILDSNEGDATMKDATMKHVGAAVVSVVTLIGSLCISAGLGLLGTDSQYACIFVALTFAVMVFVCTCLVWQKSTAIRTIAIVATLGIVALLFGLVLLGLLLTESLSPFYGIVLFALLLGQHQSNKELKKLRQENAELKRCNGNTALTEIPKDDPSAWQDTIVLRFIILLALLGYSCYYILVAITWLLTVLQ